MKRSSRIYIQREREPDLVALGREAAIKKYGASIVDKDGRAIKLPLGASWNDIMDGLLKEHRRARRAEREEAEAEKAPDDATVEPDKSWEPK